MIKFHLLLSTTFHVQMSECCIYTFLRLPPNVVCQFQSHSDLKMCLTCSHIAWRCISPYLGKLTGNRLHFILVVNGVLVTFKYGHTTRENGQINIFRQPFVTGKRILTIEVSRETALWGTWHFLLWLIAITYSYFPVKANDVAERFTFYIMNVKCHDMQMLYNLKCLDWTMWRVM